MKLFLLGSLAFDTLGHYEGHFRHLFTPELMADLSVSFVLDHSERHFGGCAGNVAYSLGLLEVPATVCGVLGFDGGHYRETMESWGMNVENIETGKGATAHAVIGTDLDGKQIAQFIPGCLEEAGAFMLPSSAEAGDLLWVGPEPKERMLAAATQGVARGLRVFVDPGQLIHAFTGKELLQFLEGAEGLFVNRFEWKILQEKTGMSSRELQAKVPLIFVTQGAEGVSVYQNDEEQHSPAIEAQEVDPTGAGDAFRAGVLAGFYRGWPLTDAVKAGTLLGAACVEHSSTQGHRISEDQARVLKMLGSS